MVFVDDMPPGPFYDLWAPLVRDPRAHMVPGTEPMILGSNRPLFANRTCFRRTVHSVHGGVSLLSLGNVGLDTVCVAPIIQAFAHWMMESMGLPAPCNAARPVRHPIATTISTVPGCLDPAKKVAAEHLPVRITWVSRKPYQQIKDDKSSKFNAAVTHGVMSEESEAAFLDHLRASLRVQAVAQGTLPPVLTSTQMEMVSVAEQLRIISESDVLMGMHGAGLAFTMFLPASSHLLEIHTYDRGANNRHYQNMAKFTQHNYTNVVIGAESGNAMTPKHHETIAQALMSIVSDFKT